MQNSTPLHSTSTKTNSLPMDLELKGPLGPLVLRVMELYRLHGSYYNFGKALALKLMIALECYKIPIIEEAIKIYEKSKDKRTGRIPYPMYVVGIAKRLDEDSNRANEDSETNSPRREKLGDKPGDGLPLWGRSI